MGKIIFYTRSGQTSPSSNYRILQYVPYIKGDKESRCLASEYLYKKHGNARTKTEKLFWYSLYYGNIQFNVFRFMIKDLLSRPDCIVVQRAISPKLIFPLNKLLLKKVFEYVPKLIWDFDDEIFNSKEITKYEAGLLEKNSDTIIVTSEFLKSRLSSEGQRKTILMATTDGDFANDDVSELLDIRRKTYDRQIELLWLATSPSLPHLYKIADELDTVAEKLKKGMGKNLILHVVCNKPLEFKPKNLIVDNVVWSRESARKMIHCSHIGIMPLVNTVSSKGKGGFKIVQYMSAAMPAVASAIGFNNEIIVNGETGFLVDDIASTQGWEDAILALSNDWSVYIKFAAAAKEEYNRKFSFKENLDRWNKIVDEK